MLRTDDNGDLEFLDTVPDGDELACTPNKAGLLDRADRLLQLGEVGLVIPRLDIEGNDRLCARSQYNFRSLVCT